MKYLAIDLLPAAFSVAVVWWAGRPICTSTRGQASSWWAMCFWLLRFRCVRRQFRHNIARVERYWRWREKKKLQQQRVRWSIAHLSFHLRVFCSNAIDGLCTAVYQPRFSLSPRAVCARTFDCFVFLCFTLLLRVCPAATRFYVPNCIEPHQAK